jgi:hypothetical protein
LTTFGKRLKMTVVSEAQLNTVPHYQGKGRPAPGRQPDYDVYRIAGGLASRPPERTRRLERQSGFILATNLLNCPALSDEELIAASKDQPQVERGFRFLKDPMFMASTRFLQSPKRIMALMMVMTLSLMIDAVLEHRLRETLTAHHETFPNPKDQPVSNPIARWVFPFFSGVQVLIIGARPELVLNWNDHQAAWLKLLGRRYEALYS